MDIKEFLMGKRVKGLHCEHKDAKPEQPEQPEFAIVDSTPPTPNPQFDVEFNGEMVARLMFSEKTGSYVFQPTETFIHRNYHTNKPPHEFTQDEMEVISHKLMLLNTYKF